MVTLGTHDDRIMTFGTYGDRMVTFGTYGDLSLFGSLFGAMSRFQQRATGTAFVRMHAYQNCQPLFVSKL